MNMDIEIIRHLQRNINDFKLEKRSFGRGQYGCVYPCIEKKNGKMYAIKLFEPSVMPYELFIREVLIQTQMKHHAILPFYRWGVKCKYESYGEVPFIISPLMKNRSLDLYINKCKFKELDPTKQMIIIYGTAVAMKYLHGKGIFHRNLKPENILLDKHYHPYISDYGFSRLVPPNTSLLNLSLNTIYTAPELLDDDCEYLSNKADVYSFGVILFNVLTGKQFCQFKSSFITIKNILEGYKPSIPKEINEFYTDLIQMCWHQSPCMRPSFEEIVDMLEKPENLLPGANKKKFDKYKKYVNEEIPRDDDNDDYDDYVYDEEEEKEEVDK